MRGALFWEVFLSVRGASVWWIIPPQGQNCAFSLKIEIFSLISTKFAFFHNFFIFETSSKTGRMMRVRRDGKIGAGGTQNADAARKRTSLARQSSPISRITQLILIILSLKQKIASYLQYSLYFYFFFIFLIW